MGKLITRSQDPYFNNVELLLHLNGTNGSTSFVDSSKNNFSITAYGNAQISTAQSKFGGSSAYFDGDGDYIRGIISNWDVGVGNEPFTIEFWTYRLNTNTHVFLSKHGGVTDWNGTDGLQISFFIDSGGVIHFDYWSNGGTLYSSLTDSVSIPINQWVHVAATYDGSITRIFINGTQTSTTSSTGYGTVTSAPIVEIGGENGSFNLNGYIDELRITKGIARYTSNLTPLNKQFYDGTIEKNISIKKQNLGGGKLNARKAASAPSGIPVASTSSVVIDSITTLNKTNYFGIGQILSGTGYFDNTGYIGLIAPQTTYNAYGTIASFGNQWIYISIEDFGEGSYYITTTSTNFSTNSSYIPTSDWSPAITITAA